MDNWKIIKNMRTKLSSDETNVIIAFEEGSEIPLFLIYNHILNQYYYKTHDNVIVESTRRDGCIKQD